MASEDDSATGTPGRRLKLQRLIDEYDLHGIGDELEDRWTAEADDRMSLRDLADYVNRELLAAALSRAGERPLAGELEHMRRTLLEDDVSEGERTQLHSRLERKGVDVDRLERDFVSYQAVRAYLTEYRDADYSPAEESRPEAEAATIQRLRGRTASVTESKLDTLRRNDDLTLGAFSTLVNVTVICEDCDSQYEVGDLLDRGGCDCDGE